MDGNVLRDVLRVDRQHPDDARLLANKVDHAHTSALPASTRPPPDIPHPTRAWDHITKVRILGESLLKRRVFLVGEAVPDQLREEGGLNEGEHRANLRH